MLGGPRGSPGDKVSRSRATIIGRGRVAASSLTPASGGPASEAPSITRKHTDNIDHELSRHDRSNLSGSSRDEIIASFLVDRRIGRSTASAHPEPDVSFVPMSTGRVFTVLQWICLSARRKRLSRFPRSIVARRAYLISRPEFGHAGMRAVHLANDPAAQSNRVCGTRKL